MGLQPQEEPNKAIKISLYDGCLCLNELTAFRPAFIKRVLIVHEVIWYDSILTLIVIYVMHFAW